MTRSERDRGALIGAALVLGVLALLLGSDVRNPGREACPSPPLECADQARAPSVSTDSLAPERHAPARDRLDASPARADSLRVDVVDAGGRPAAGVPIAFGTVSTSRPGVFEARLRTCTDAEGSAWVELAALAALHATDQTDDELWLRGEILAEPLPEVVLAPEVMAARHVVL